MKKCLPYRKKQCFVKVAMLQKMTDKLKKYNNFSSIFRPKSMQNRAKNREKREKRQKSTKTRPWRAHFRSMARFWVIFGCRPGAKNRSHGASEVQKKLSPQTRFCTRRPLGTPGPSRMAFSMNFGSPGTLPGQFLELFSFIF